MWKTGLKLTLALASALILWGCGNKKSSSNSNGTSTQCLYNPATGGCDNSVYNQYGGWGFQPYPMPGVYSSDPNSPFRYRVDQYYGFGGMSSALCSCPQGSRPVYNGGLGLGCAAATAIPNWLPIYYHATWTISGPSVNNHYVNVPQVSNITGTFYNYGGCYSNVAWSCLLSQPNQCPSGTTCRATAQNSPIGLCVRQ